MHRTQNTEKIASTRKVQIVFISGNAGVGKTEAAKYLMGGILSNPEYIDIKTVIYPLAEPIKRIAYWEFGWDGKKDERGRRLLQVIGTDVGRAYNENIWVEKLSNKVSEQILIPNFVFVDDWRFPNEADFFNDNILFEITRIRIDRKIDKENEIYQHPSEVSLPNNNDGTEYRYDFFIENYGTLEEFNGKLDEVLAYLKTKIIFR